MGWKRGNNREGNLCVGQEVEMGLFPLLLPSPPHQTLQARNSLDSAVEGWGPSWLSEALLGRAGMTDLDDQDLDLLETHC